VKQLPSVAALYEQMDQARRAGPLVTNFYPVPDKLQRWIERGQLYSMTASNVLFVLRRDRDFLHVSFVTSAAAELATAVRELIASIAETITVDLLGPRDRMAELVDLFARAGFRPQRELHRMTRQVEHGPPPAEPDPEVVLAGAGDGAALAGMLETELDRFTEQIPDEDEMARAAAERKILIVRADPARADSAIAGMLFYELTGRSSLLRHWVVDPAHRDRRIGARLMRRYFADCRDVRRFLLWVISDNHNAIDRYRHYGYLQDGLIDQVLIRRPS
jgi:ribosomal protein S18 acetylase RimI-like enzyme